MESGQTPNQQAPAQELYQKLRKMNEKLQDKEEDLVSVRAQLQTLENNINAQVEEFLRSLSVTNLNLQTRFLEVQRNNQELRNIKEYIINAKLQPNSFTFGKILEVLGLNSVEEIYNSNALPHRQPQNQENKENEEEKQKIEEDKSMDVDRPNTLLPASNQPMPNNSNMQNKSNEKCEKVDDFEDDDFKFQFNKPKQNTEKLQPNPDADRGRAASSSVLENSLNPQFLNFSKNKSNKRFKTSEEGGVDASQMNMAMPTFGMPQQPPSLPLLPNLQIDPEIICQMLIRKLAANSGLSNLNDICRILPDTILNRTRSNTD